MFRRTIACTAIALATTLVLGLAVSCGGGGGSSSAAPETWTARQLTGGCVRGPGTLPRSSCRQLVIDGPGVPPLQVDLRVIEPDPGVPLLGTVLLGTGAGGDVFYAERSGGEELLRELTSLGFRLVDRSWRSAWWGSGPNFLVQSRRYATLLEWVHTNIHTDGMFCVTGNSSGAGEIGYALTTWGSAGLIDTAVFTAGPPMTRLDWVCRLPASASWLTRCQTLVPTGVMTCAPMVCSLTPTSEGAVICSVSSGNPNLTAWSEDSILHPGAVVDFGSTHVRVVVGTDDCFNATVSGLLFFDEVQSEKVLEFAPNTGHIVAGSQAGRDAIIRGLLGAIPGRAGPATLSASSWPRVGHPFEVRLQGRAGEAFQVFSSLQVCQPKPSPFGWWFLEAPFVSLGGGFFRAADGRATFAVQIPADSALEGLTLYDQVLAGSRLTNALRVVVRP